MMVVGSINFVFNIIIYGKIKFRSFSFRKVDVIGVISYGFLGIGLLKIFGIMFLYWLGF